MTPDRFKDGIQWWMDTTRPMSTALYPNPPQWHIDTGNLVRLVPQREWVGLTDEEIGRKTILAGFNPEWKVEIGMVFSIVKNLETKLKERNHGT